MEHNNQANAGAADGQSQAKQNGKGGYKGKNFNPGFKAGTGRLLVNTTTLPVPNEFHEFTFSPDGILEFGQDLAHTVEYRRLSTFNDNIGQGLLIEGTDRMARLAMAKKLATSVDKSTASAYVSDLRSLRGFPISMPRPLLNVVEGLGSFTHGDGQWRAADVMFWSGHLIVSATMVPGQHGVPINVNRGTLFVNLQVTDSLQNAYTYFSTVYNRWARNTDAVIAIPNDLRVMHIRPPHTYDGWAVLNALLAAGFVQPPADVRRALNALVAIEEGMVRNAVPDQQLIAELQVVSVVLVAWDRGRIEERISAYVRQVEQLLAPLYSTDYDWVDNVTNFASEGQPWQLLNCNGAERATHPFAVPQGQADVGFMLGSAVRFEFNARQMQTFSDKTPREMRLSYLKSNKRGN